MSILEALVPPRRDDHPLRVVGVADLNPEAPGILYAYRHNLLVTVDFTDLFQLPELDIIVNATGHPEVSRQLNEQRPERSIVLNVDRPLFLGEISGTSSPWSCLSQETAPLSIGIVGGGKGGQEVLQLITGDRATGGALKSSGWPIPIPRPRDVVLAQRIGDSDFYRISALSGRKSGSYPGAYRRPAGAGKHHPAKGPAHPDHRPHQGPPVLGLLHWEEDWLRSKVESEIKLAGQRNHFQRIFDHLPDPVLVLNPNYLVEEANLTFLNRFHKKADEVVGRHCYEVFHQFDEPCDRQGMPCPLPERSGEVSRPSKVLQAIPIPMAPCAMMKSPCRPCVRRKVPRRESSRSSKMSPPASNWKRPCKVPKKGSGKSKSTFLETIVNGIEDHMMVIDLDYRIIEVNRALLEMVGLKREEVVGKHCYEVSHHLEKPCTTPDHPCPLKEAVATGKAASATHVHFDKDGREHYFHVVCHPLYDEEGRVQQVIDLSRDITQEINCPHAGAPRRQDGLFGEVVRQRGA